MNASHATDFVRDVMGTARKNAMNAGKIFLICQPLKEIPVTAKKNSLMMLQKLKQPIIANRAMTYVQLAKKPTITVKLAMTILEL